LDHAIIFNRLIVDLGETISLSFEISTSRSIRHFFGLGPTAALKLSFDKHFCFGLDHDDLALAEIAQIAGFKPFQYRTRPLPRGDAERLSSLCRERNKI